MIGGFVEQENIGFREQESGECDAAALSTREGLDGCIRRGTTEGAHSQFKPRIQIPGIGVVERILQFGLLGDEGIEIGVRFAKAEVDLFVPRQHVDKGLHGFADGLNDGFGFVELGFLLQQADGVTLRHGYLADIVGVNTGHDAQQGRFARSVQAENADLGAVIEAERDIAQDLFVVGGMDAANAHHRVNYLLGVCGHFLIPIVSD